MTATIASVWTSGSTSRACSRRARRPSARARAARWRSTASTPSRTACSAKATASASAAASAATRTSSSASLIDQHVKKAEARALYDDVTPKPTPEEIEDAAAWSASIARRARRPPARPTAGARREIRRLKEACGNSDRDCVVPRNQEVIRQWKVLHALESSRHGVTIDALADELEVTTRTIRRDLAALQEAGFPLYDERDDDGPRALAPRRPGAQGARDRLHAGRAVRAVSEPQPARVGGRHARSSAT